MADIPISAWIIQSREEADNLLISGGKLILITEDIPDYLNSPQYGTSCIKANSLLPSYEAVSCYLDGDYMGFSNSYKQMLMQPESSIYFATIISAIINSIPIGFIFGTEEIEAVSTIEFLNFMLAMYGIKLGHLLPYREELPIPNGFMSGDYTTNNMSLLYMNNLLTPYEYLFIIPDDNIPYDCMQKLIFEIRPLVRNLSDMGEYIEYFSNMKKSMRTSNTVLIDPMVQA